MASCKENQRDRRQKVSKCPDSERGGVTERPPGHSLGHSPGGGGDRGADEKRRRERSRSRPRGEAEPGEGAPLWPPKREFPGTCGASRFRRPACRRREGREFSSKVMRVRRGRRRGEPATGSVAAKRRKAPARNRRRPVCQTAGSREAIPVQSKHHRRKFCFWQIICLMTCPRPPLPRLRWRWRGRSRHAR